MNKKRPTYKNFHIDYLPLLNEDKLGNTEPFNLLPYIEMCCKKDVSKRVSNYNGEVCRLQDIENIKILPEKLHERDLWKLNFVRIKTNSMTGVANEDGSYDPEYIAKKLSDKDYLAEPTTCIYDSAYNTIIISRNRDGILPSGILEFFKKITGIRSLKFGIIPTKTTFSKANTNIYRNISIGIDDLDKLDERSKTFLEKRCNSVFGAITALKPYQNINLRLNLSMGKANKKQGMNVQKVNEELQALIEADIDNVVKLELSSKEDENIKIETIDLLSDKVHDKFSLSVSKEKVVTHERLNVQLLKSYNKMYDYIKNIMDR